MLTELRRALLERLGHGRSRRNDEARRLGRRAALVAVVVAAAGRDSHASGEEGRAASPPQETPLSIITDVALTAAVACTPRASPSSSTASRVTAAVTRNGPASISTSAITPSTSTERTTPGKRFRADNPSPARWRSG